MFDQNSDDGRLTNKHYAEFGAFTATYVRMLINDRLDTEDTDDPEDIAFREKVIREYEDFLNGYPGNEISNFAEYVLKSIEKAVAFEVASIGFYKNGDPVDIADFIDQEDVAYAKEDLQKGMNGMIMMAGIYGAAALMLEATREENRELQQQIIKAMLGSLLGGIGIEELGDDQGAPDDNPFSFLGDFGDEGDDGPFDLG